MQLLQLCVAVVALALQPALATTQVCSLYSASVQGDTLFSYNSFSDSTPLIKTWTSVVDNKLRLAEQETNGGTVGYVWHNVRERIADGFISEFKFKITTSQPNKVGDGFTYFIQNDKIVNLNGGTGSKLGSFGIGKSIAIKFDLCTERATGSCAPTEQSISLVMMQANYTVLAPNPTVPVPANINLADGNEHTVRVIYGGRALGVESKLKVVLDNTNTVFEITVGDLSSSTLFDDRFAYFGFTASTSWRETADIDILQWKTEMAPSDSAVQGYNPQTPMQLTFGQRSVLTLHLRDTCKRNIGLPSATPNVSSTLFQIPTDPNTDPRDYVYLQGNITNNMDGSFSITYDLPFHLGYWDLDVVVNGVRSEGMPWMAGIQSVQPPPPEGPVFPVWALVLLILLILLIIAVLGYILYRLRRYKKKLAENAEFIEEGKQQAKLDRLEDGVKYQANPMVGTLDDLKEQLKKNEEELARLKALDEYGSQQSFTIESLQKQRNELMEEMNRLKKEEQEEELKRKKQEVVVTAGSRAKKEFGREQVG